LYSLILPRPSPTIFLVIARLHFLFILLIFLKFMSLYFSVYTSISCVLPIIQIPLLDSIDPDYNLRHRPRVPPLFLRKLFTWRPLIAVQRRTYYDLCPVFDPSEPNLSIYCTDYRLPNPNRYRLPLPYRRTHEIHLFSSPSGDPDQ